MKRRAALVGLLAAALAPNAFAQNAGGGVRIAPVMLEMVGARRVTSFRLENRGAQARAFEITPKAWSQPSGEDVLEDTRALITTPSVFEVAPGATQIVRLALAQGEQAATSEHAFRLWVSEIPMEDAPRINGLRVRLDISMPLFVRPERCAAGALATRWRDGAVDIVNTGGAHVRLAELRIGDERVAAPNYVLAGTTLTRQAQRAPVRARYQAGVEPIIDGELTDAPSVSRAP